jgi:uncharacterized protein
MMFARALLVVFWLLPAGALAQDTGAVQFRKDRVEVVSASGRHPFTVELAITPEEQAAGLMERPYLAPDAGMLFLFNPPRAVNMWMKNTLIPLDMLFINDECALVALEENTKPHSEALIAPKRDDIAAVLELPGGTAQRLQIGVGSLVERP